MFGDPALFHKDEMTKLIKLNKSDHTIEWLHTSFKAHINDETYETYTLYYIYKRDGSGQNEVLAMFPLRIYLYITILKRKRKQAGNRRPPQTLAEERSCVYFDETAIGESLKRRGSKIRACSHSDLGEFLF